MADLTLAEEHAYRIATYFRDNAGRLLQHCIPEIALMLEAFAEEKQGIAPKAHQTTSSTRPDVVFFQDY